MLMELLDDLKYDDLDEDQQELADCIGFESYKKLISTYGGINLNIRLPSNICLNTRNKKIREEFNGGNHKQLAIKYKLSESTIYRIVAKGYKK